MNQYIVLAGGKIKCRRCLARSTRTGQQCQRPALRLSQTQKCQFHGGRSTGAKTDEGRQCIANAHYRHGESSKAARQAYSQASAHLRRLEESMYVLGITTAPRTRGRKPMGYTPIQTIQDVCQMVIDLELPGCCIILGQTFPSYLGLALNSSTLVVSAAKWKRRGLPSSR